MEGLLPAAGYTDGDDKEGKEREITLTIKTDNDQEWVHTERMQDWEMVHHNNINVLADSWCYSEDEAKATPIIPTLVKGRGNRGNVYRYLDGLNDGGHYPTFEFFIAAGGVTDEVLTPDKKLVIVDHFDSDLWKLFSTELDSEHNFSTSWDWLNPRLYYSSNPLYPSSDNDATRIDLTTGDVSMEFDEQTGQVTFTVSNLPTRANGEYYDFYHILYHIVPKDPESLTELKRRAVVEVLPGETAGVEVMTNTAEWPLAELTDDQTYQFESIMMTKDLVEMSGSWAVYQIVINPDGFRINNGEDLTLVDDFSPKLKEGTTDEYWPAQSVDYNSITASSDKVSWDYSGYQGTYKIPDGTPVIINYRSRITGVMGETVEFENTATLTPGPYVDDANGTYTLTPSSATGVGSAGVYRVDLFKYADKHMESGLPYTTFRLLDANKRPMVYRNRLERDGVLIHDKGDPIIFKTDEFGHAWVELLQRDDGVAIKKNTPYFLEEIDPPMIIDPENPENNVYFQKDNTLYSCIITTDPSYNAEGAWKYYNGDIVKIRNYEDTAGLNITKRFSGNIEPPEEVKENLTFAVQKKTGADNWETVRTFTYADMTGNALHQTELLETDTTYRIVETGDAWAEQIHTAPV